MYICMMKVLPFKIPKPDGIALIYQVDDANSFYDKLHQHDEKVTGPDLALLRYPVTSLPRNVVRCSYAHALPPQDACAISNLSPSRDPACNAIVVRVASETSVADGILWRCCSFRR